MTDTPLTTIVPEVSWRRVAALFGPHQRRVIGISALVLASAVIGIVNPLLIRSIFDTGLFPAEGTSDLGLVVTLSIIMLVITLGSTALGVVQTVVTNPPRIGRGRREGRSLDELLAAGGVYAELYHDQFGDGKIETTTSDATMYKDGGCEYFASLNPERQAELRAAHGHWD